MKIIYCDNIPTDMSSEYLFLDNIKPEEYDNAIWIINKLNSKLGDNQGPFYRLVEDNHKLYKFEY